VLLRRAVKQEEEQGGGSHSNLSGRDLRAMIRSSQAASAEESAQPEGCSGSAKGEHYVSSLIMSMGTL